LEANGQAISFEHGTVQMTASDNWLQNAKIRLLNASGKTLNNVLMEILYYQGDNKKHSLMVGLAIGSHTGYPGVKPNLWITPDQSFDITIPNEKFEALRNAIAVARASNISTGMIKLQVVQIMFDGEPDVAWRRGYWMRRDPANPKSFRRIDQASQKIEKISLKTRGYPASKALSASPNTACWDLGGFHYYDCVGYPPEGLSCFLVSDELSDYPGIYLLDPFAFDICYNATQSGFCFIFDYHDEAYQGC
jgi:hypothetical protein